MTTFLLICLVIRWLYVEWAYRKSSQAVIDMYEWINRRRIQ